MTSNAGYGYLASEVNWRKVSLTSWGSHNTSPHKSNLNLTFHSSFGENCRQIVNYSYIPLNKINTEKKIPLENCSMQTPALGEFPPRNDASLQESEIVF